jgi:hypothetical protein
MSKPHATRAHFHAGHNDAGYLPEADVASFATFEDAKAYMIAELLQAADHIASWADEHDCDDIPCPSFGDACPEQLANSVALAAEELNLENGPEWFASLSDGRSLPVSWWISPCYDDCHDEDADDCPCLECEEDRGHPTFEHPYSGSVTISGDPRADIAEAVELDHGCEDVACDIHAALGHGFVFVAAHSVMSATDAEVTSGVVGWYLEHGPEWFAGRFGTHAYDCAEWDGWSDHHEHFARPCADCGSYSYAERNFEPLECGACGNELVPSEAHALRIAAEWHPGMTSALYAFASSGAVRPDLRAEVETEVCGDERTLLLRWLDRNAPEPDLWGLLESPPAGCADVAALWSWSLNYDGGKGPATLFLDLIGYSEDEHGQALYDLSSASLGYVEVEHLRDALSDWLADPSGVRCYVGQLLEAEASQ